MNWSASTHWLLNQSPGESGPRTLPQRQRSPKEWAKLRAADEGRGTWEESAVQDYHSVKARAKKLKADTGIPFTSLLSLIYAL